MPLAFISQSSIDAATRTNTTVTAPANIQDRDILRLYFSIDSDPGPMPTITPPTGFSQIASNDATNVLGGSGVGDLSARVWEKRASGEAGSYTITHASSFTSAYIEVIRGAWETGNAEDFTATTNFVDANGTNYTATGGTTSNDNSYITFASMCWNDGSPFTPPTGTTPQFNERYDPAGGTLYIAGGILATAGSTGDKTATGNTQGADGGQIGVLTSVKEQPLFPPMFRGS
jgi:hypothetical protein